MKLTNKDIQEIKNVLHCCRILDIPGVVFHEGKAYGCRLSYDAAIITDASLSLPPETKLGIGRIGELDKRLSIFSSSGEGDIVVNDHNDVKVITFSEGRSKVQFRCTASGLIKYPKRNEDPPKAIITMTQEEALQVVKAAKTLGSEDVTIQITRNGDVKIFCVDASNDRYEIELSEQVKYIDEPDSAVQKYLSSLFTVALDQMAREGEKIEIVIGEVGSLTGTVKGHTIIIFALNSEGEED